MVCKGQTVVVESPTVPTLSLESKTSPTFAQEAGALTISVDPDDIDPCGCAEEIVAITTVLYDGAFFYDGDAIYSGTLAE